MKNLPIYNVKMGALLPLVGLWVACGGGGGGGGSSATSLTPPTVIENPSLETARIKWNEKQQSCVDANNEIKYNSRPIGKDAECVDMSQKNLTGTDFSDFNLTGVNFKNSILSSVNLEGATIKGLILEGVVVDSDYLLQWLMSGTKPSLPATKAPATSPTILITEVATEEIAPEADPEQTISFLDDVGEVPTSSHQSSLSQTEMIEQIVSLTETSTTPIEVAKEVEAIKEEINSDKLASDINLATLKVQREVQLAVKRVSELKLLESKVMLAAVVEPLTSPMSPVVPEPSASLDPAPNGAAPNSLQNLTGNPSISVPSTTQELAPEGSPAQSTNESSIDNSGSIPASADSVAASTPAPAPAADVPVAPVAGDQAPVHETAELAVLIPAAQIEALISEETAVQAELDKGINLTLNSIVEESQLNQQINEQIENINLLEVIIDNKVEASVKASDNSIETLNLKVTQINSQINDLKQERLNLQNAIKVMNQKIQAVQVDNKDFRAQINAITDQINRIKTSTAKLSSDSKAQILSLKNQAAQLKDKILANNKIIAEFRVQRAEPKTKFDKVNAAIVALLRERKVAKTELQQLKIALAAQKLKVVK